MSIEDNLPELVKRLQAGDESAMLPWCEYFQPEIKRQTKAFVKWAGNPIGPNMRDDLASEGMVAVLETAKRIREVTDTDWSACAKGYTHHQIKWRMHDLLTAEMACSPKQAKTLRRILKNGDAPPAFRSVNESDAWSVNTDIAVMELWEEIEACCLDEQELTVIRALADDMTLEEVAPIAGCHLSTVMRIRERVWQRYQERSDS